MIKKRQFPVCARCFGVYLGQTLGLAGFFIFRTPPFFAIIGLMGVLFLDWYAQNLRLIKSNNFFRALTGAFGGLGVSGLIVSGFWKALEFLNF